MDRYIGKMLDDRYELLERIGTGGMAVVYKARCHRLNRLVAVKILKPELAEDAEFRRRFHDESRAVAMLSHPNIVAVYDVSRSNNLDYIVMELIDGITLKQYMQKRGTPLNWREALHFITQIVKALGHAHSRGIIHRDIKPHNVMVLRDGSVKVADFGIARLVSAAQATLTQEALGSVHYISPEQAKGSHVDGRSDIYSAGVVLYEMITGRLPYEGETPVSVAIQHINSIPIPPRELNPDLPEALEAITLKAMSPAVEQRYPSADDMLADLEEFRKNPNISFEYSPAELHVYEDEGEPTQVVPPQHRAEREDGPRRQSEGAAHRSGAHREDPPAYRSGSAHREDVPAHRGGSASYRDGASSRRRREEEYEDDYDDYEDEGPRRRGFPVAIVAVLAIAAFVGGILWFLWKSFLGPLLSPPETFEVPDLRGMTVEEIMADAEIMDMWRIVPGEETISTDEYEFGEVAEQEPAAKTVVREGERKITVYLSGGKEDGEIRMPSLTGKELREARDALSRGGIGLDLDIRISEQSSESITKDYVISTEPAMGTVLEDGQTVIIIVSTGPASRPVTVPLVERQPLETARAMLEGNKLVVGSPTMVSHDTIPEGHVVFQSISYGQQVEEGTVVYLQVSTGPARPVDSDPPPTESDDPTPPESDDPTPPESDDPTPPPSDDPTPPPSDDPTPPPSDDPTPPPSDDPTPPPSDDPAPPPNTDPSPPPVADPDGGESGEG